MSGEMSKRKRNALLRRKRRLPEEPSQRSRNECSAVAELKALPPEQKPPEGWWPDTRMQDEIRSTLRRVLGEDGGFHGPLPRRRIGLD
jgi:hypothetical protein